MRKFIFSLTMLATFLLGASTVEAQNYPYDKIYTQNLQFHCGGYNRVTNVSLYESPVTGENCSTKKMKITFELEGYNVIKKFNYEFTIYKTPATTAGFQPIYSGEIYEQFAINSFSHEFELPTQFASANQMYFIQFDDIGLPNSCYAPSQFSSSHFFINWKNLPILPLGINVGRLFGLDGDFSNDVAPRVKCAGDNMVLKLHNEMINKLNCTYNPSSTMPYALSCNGAYAGFIITKTDANWTPIDAPKYIGTQKFADTEGVNGSPNFLLEDFTDPNTGLAKNIHLLDVFNQYMNNNYGYYNIQLKYANYCSKYQDNMQIEYGTIITPIIRGNVLANNGSSHFIEVPTNTSFSNPFSSCETTSSFSVETVNGISSQSDLDVVVERFDNLTGNSDGIVYTHAYSNWSSSQNLDLGAEIKSANIYNLYDDLGGLLDPSHNNYNQNIYTIYGPSYEDNRDDIYKVTLEYTTSCGAMTTEFWYTPIMTNCKTGGNNISDNSIFSVQSKIYPNPVADDLNISYISLQENATLTIRDILGKIVYMENIKNKNLAINQKIDVSTLEKGMYFIEFESINGREQLKFMK